MSNLALVRKKGLGRGSKLVRISDAILVFGAFLASIGGLVSSTTVGSAIGVLGSVLVLVFHFVGKRAAALQHGDRTRRSAEAMLRFLTSSRAFDVPPDHGQPVKEGKALYRVTAFWPTWVEVEGVQRFVLVPMLRAYQGQAIEPADSFVFFNKGEAFAGLAWQQPEMPLGNDTFKSIDDFTGTDRETLWQQQWIAEKVPPRVLDKMGRGSEDPDFQYIKHVRSIACFGLRFADIEIVISIDSLLSEAFRPEYLPVSGGQANLFVIAGVIGQEAGTPDGDKMPMLPAIGKLRPKALPPKRID